MRNNPAMSVRQTTREGGGIRALRTAGPHLERKYTAGRAPTHSAVEWAEVADPSGR